MRSQSAFRSRQPQSHAATLSATRIIQTIERAKHLIERLFWNLWLLFGLR